MFEHRNTSITLGWKESTRAIPDGGNQINQQGKLSMYTTGNNMKSEQIILVIIETQFHGSGFYR